MNAGAKPQVDEALEDEDRLVSGAMRVQRKCAVATPRDNDCLEQTSSVLGAGEHGRQLPPDEVSLTVAVLKQVRLTPAW